MQIPLLLPRRLPNVLNKRGGPHRRPAERRSTPVGHREQRGTAAQLEARAAIALPQPHPALCWTCSFLPPPQHSPLVRPEPSAEPRPFPPFPGHSSAPLQPRCCRPHVTSHAHTASPARTRRALQCSAASPAPHHGPMASAHDEWLLQLRWPLRGAAARPAHGCDPSRGSWTPNVGKLRHGKGQSQQRPARRLLRAQRRNHGSQGH